MSTPIIGQVYEIFADVNYMRPILWDSVGQINKSQLRSLYPTWGELMGEYVVIVRPLDEKDGINSFGSSIYRVRGIRHNILFNLNMDYTKHVSPLIQLALVDHG